MSEMTMSLRGYYKRKEDVLQEAALEEMSVEAAPEDSNDRILLIPDNDSCDQRSRRRTVTNLLWTPKKRECADKC